MFRAQYNFNWLAALTEYWRQAWGSLLSPLTTRWYKRQSATIFQSASLTFVFVRVVNYELIRKIGMAYWLLNLSSSAAADKR